MEVTQKLRRISLTGDDEIDLSEYLSVLRERWKAVVLCTLAGTCIGASYVFVAQPVYRADAMFQIEDGVNSTQGMLGQLASVFDTKQSAIAEIEVIKSRKVVMAAVDELHLEITALPRYVPLVGAAIARRHAGDSLAPPMLWMSKFAWGGERIDVSRFDVPRDTYEKRYTLVAGQGGYYDLLDPDGNAVLHGKAGELSQAGAIALRVDRLTARPGTQFRLVRTSALKAAAKLQTALAFDDKSKQADIIKMSLDGPDATRTALILSAIANAYLKQNIDRKSADAEHALTFLDEQLPVLRKQLEAAETRYNDYRNKKGATDMAEESKLLLQQVVDNQTKLGGLQQNRAELGQRFAEGHPAMQSIDAQIGTLDENQKRLNSRIASLPNTEQEAVRLLRDVRVNTELYMNLLDSAQQLRITKAAQIGNVRLVDDSAEPETPVWPKGPVIVAVTTLLGLVAGTMAAFARRIFVGGVERSEDVESALGVPVFAVVPRSPEQRRLSRLIRRKVGDGARVLATSSPEDIAIEGIRSLRTALKFGLGGAANNIIALTGPRPAGGKSFISQNLAAVLASGNKRVLLIDGDLRRGHLHEALGISREPGLADVIRGANLADAIVRGVLPGVDLLPRGAESLNSAELLLSDRLKATLDECSAAYDFVVIDTPPVLAVTDPVLICRYAGVSLLILRYGRSPITEVVDAANRLRNGGVRLNGVLMNDMPLERMQYGAAYYGNSR
ncbi:GNVR domain-containing protein [Burkholderia pyrrocinia]|uniref:GNVR domain-containing protein n=1 Tax=Burkholderia pyrrocinia TaxID=60550 RepID=UPI0030CACB03